MADLEILIKHGNFDSMAGRGYYYSASLFTKNSRDPLLAQVTLSKRGDLYAVQQFRLGSSTPELIDILPEEDAHKAALEVAKRIAQDYQKEWGCDIKTELKNL